MWITPADQPPEGHNQLRLPNLAPASQSSVASHPQPRKILTQMSRAGLLVRRIFERTTKRSFIETEI